MTPENNHALLIAAFVFLPGALSALAWRNMAGLRIPSSAEERTAGMAVWSAINGSILLVCWGAIQPRLEALLSGGGTVYDRITLAGIVIVVPFAIAVAAGYVSRFRTVRDWMQRNGIIDSEASPPWDRITAPRGDRTPGFTVYFDHAGRQYRCESARTSREQILGRKLEFHDSKAKQWVDMPHVTGVLLLNFGERVLFLDEDEPI